MYHSPTRTLFVQLHKWCFSFFIHFVRTWFLTALLSSLNDSYFHCTCILLLRRVYSIFTALATGMHMQSKPPDGMLNNNNNNMRNILAEILRFSGCISYLLERRMKIGDVDRERRDREKERNGRRFANSWMIKDIKEKRRKLSERASKDRAISFLRRGSSWQNSRRKKKKRLKKEEVLQRLEMLLSSLST